MPKLNPYPAYKDSGVSWLGAIPSRWSLLPAFGGYVPKQTKNTGMIERTVLSLSYGRVVVKPPEKLHGLVPESFETYQIVDPGDIVVRTTDLQNDQTSLRIGRALNRGIITSAYMCLTARNPLNSEFGYQILNAYDLLKVIYGFGSGLRQSLGFDDIKRMPIPVPPADEQQAIVRYLDYIDHRIRRYVQAKQKLIALLDEQKHAIIHRAVTRGLDPNARLKPSGVEWLGDLPEHWTLKRFKFLARIASGQIDPREPIHKTKYLIAPNHVISGAGAITHLESADEQGADSGKYEVKKGQIIYSKIRPNLRKAVIAPVDCLCSADMYPIAVDERQLRTQFLLLLLLSVPFTRFAVDSSLRVAMPKVNREALGDAWLWYPSLAEQEGILNRVKALFEPLDLALVVVRRHVAFMREYRTRLIADVVTGKLDVREAAAALPSEEADGEELLEEMVAEGETEEETAELAASEEVEA